MELKQSYKQSDIGFIPEDWNCVTMGEIGKTIIGLTYSPNDVSSYGTLVLRSSNIQQNQLKYDNNVFVDMDVPPRVIVKENDLLICVRNGSKHLIGKCALIDKNAVGFAFGAFMSIYRSEFSKYIFYSFQSNVIQRQIDETMGATINQLTNKNLSEFKIPLPPLLEQIAIAQVLSDTDNLIQAIEQKLSKRRNIKQGAMQQMLIPKDDWEVRLLGEIAKFRRGSFPQPYGLPIWYDEYTGTPFVQVFDVDKNMKLKSSTKQKISDAAKDKSVFVEKGNIILTIQGSIGRIAITQYDAYVDRTLLIFTDYKVPIDKVFFAYVIQEKFRIEKENAPGGIIKTITKEALSKYDIPLPKSKQEQSHIASVLSDMDIELEQLENKLLKCRQLKQGLMQNLLTGKIRLV